MTELQQWANKTVAAHKDHMIKQFQSRRPVVIARPQSKSDPSVQYMVKKYPSGELVCNCPGYLYRKSCRHTWGGQYNK